jgi:hypothetical protein
MSTLLATLRGSPIGVTLFVLLVQTVGAQIAVSAPQRTIEKEEGCPVLKPYAELDKFGKFYFPEAVYEEARTQTEYQCRHILYRSDEMRVSGYIFTPKATRATTLPAILYNRGGTGDFSLIDDLVRVEFYLLAKEGYVVLATEYRSIGDKGRRDEWGGADVKDLLNLVAVAKGLGYIDMDRMFMLGVSRGGMMTYLALKNKVPVKAAAVIAGPSDLESLAAIRSDFLNGDDGYDGWAKVWPDFEHRKEEHFRARFSDRLGRPNQYTRLDPSQPGRHQSTSGPSLRYR